MKSSISRKRASTARGTVIRNRRQALRTMRIRHREFISDVASLNDTGQLSRMQINPGLATFPWLSNVAGAFEKYRWLKLKFMWTPACPTSTPGSIALCPDYDAADDDLQLTKSEVLSFADSVRGPVWMDFALDCDRANMNTGKYYVRNTSVPTSSDVKMYDALQLLIYVSNCPSDRTNLGELWVEYEVELSTPQLQSVALHEDDDATVFAGPNAQWNMILGPDPNYVDNNIEMAGPLPEQPDGNYFSIGKPGHYILSFLHEAASELTGEKMVQVVDGPPGSEITLLDYVEQPSTYSILQTWYLVIPTLVSVAAPLIIRFWHYFSEGIPLVTRTRLGEYAPSSVVLEGRTLFEVGGNRCYISKSSLDKAKRQGLAWSRSVCLQDSREEASASCAVSARPPSVIR